MHKFPPDSYYYLFPFYVYRYKTNSDIITWRNTLLFLLQTLLSFWDFNFRTNTKINRTSQRKPFFCFSSHSPRYTHGLLILAQFHAKNRRARNYVYTTGYTIADTTESSSLESLITSTLFSLTNDYILSTRIPSGRIDCCTRARFGDGLTSGDSDFRQKPSPRVSYRSQICILYVRPLSAPDVDRRCSYAEFPPPPLGVGLKRRAPERVSEPLWNILFIEMFVEFIMYEHRFKQQLRV